MRRLLTDAELVEIETALRRLDDMIARGQACSNARYYFGAELDEARVLMDRCRYLMDRRFYAAAPVGEERRLLRSGL